MKNYRRALSIALCVVALSSGRLAVSADTHQKDIARIKSAIRQMDAASNRRDLTGFIAFTHPDFVNIDKDGQETTHGKKDRYEKIGRLFSMAKQITSHTIVKRIDFSREGATVEISSTNRVIMPGANGDAVFRGGGTYHDLWVKTSAGWLQKRSRTITQSIMVDGGPQP